MWRFCASLPLFPSLCTPGLRVNDPCLPTSKGHGPMACIVQPPFWHFYMVFFSRFMILCLHFCQRILTYIFNRLSGSANQNSEIYASLPPKKCPRFPTAVSESHFELTFLHCACLQPPYWGILWRMKLAKIYKRFFFLQIFDCYRTSDVLKLCLVTVEVHLKMPKYYSITLTLYMRHTTPTCYTCCELRL